MTRAVGGLFVPEAALRVSPAHDEQQPFRSECERGESNPYARGHRDLNPARLPVPPLSRAHIVPGFERAYGGHCPAERRAVGVATVRVRLVDVPVALFCAAEQHANDLLREVALVAAARPDNGKGHLFAELL